MLAGKFHDFWNGKASLFLCRFSHIFVTPNLFHCASGSQNAHDYLPNCVTPSRWCVCRHGQHTPLFPCVMMGGDGQALEREGRPKTPELIQTWQLCNEVILYSLNCWVGAAPTDVGRGSSCGSLSHLREPMECPIGVVMFYCALSSSAGFCWEKWIIFCCIELKLQMRSLSSVLVQFIRRWGLSEPIEFSGSQE